MNVRKPALILCALIALLWGYEMDISEFEKRVEQYSIPLIQSKAQFDSSLQDYRSSLSWNPSFIESQVTLGKPGANNALNVESETLLMLTPRLPWVVWMLKSSLNIKTLQYKKNYELLKNLALIGARRIYFNYKLMEEKYEIYQQIEQIFLSQLKIAEAKLRAGSLSQRECVNFRNSYYGAKLARIESEKMLTNLRASLLKILGLNDINGEILVRDLKFDYPELKLSHLEKLAQNSPYLEILALSAKDHAMNARASGAMSWDHFQIGAGLQNTTQGALQQNLAIIKLQVPLPLTAKYSHLKKKFLILQGAALQELEVAGNNLKVEAKSYAKQLKIKHKYIDLLKESVANKKTLMEMEKTAYEAQRVNLFEYLTYQNAYMESLIQNLDARLDYIQTHTLLEEALGVVLTQEKNQGKNNE